jgi:hypothetical protein
MRIICALAFLSTAAPALAQTNTARTAAPKVRYEAKTHIDVTEAETVEGSTESGDGLFVEAKRPMRHASLIRVRTDFLPEMMQSAERL